MIICIMGKSGTGKDTVTEELINSTSLKLERLVPYTTRPKRPNEIEGREYHFVTEETYKTLLLQDKIIESREYPHYIDGNVRYFTVNDIDPQKDYILITVPEAFRTIADYCEGKSIGVKGIYLDLDPLERLERLSKREKETGGQKYEELIRRYIADEKDYSKEKLDYYFKDKSKILFKNDYLHRQPISIVKNENLQGTVGLCEYIISGLQKDIAYSKQSDSKTLSESITEPDISL